jgi:hypothetical protein
MLKGAVGSGALWDGYRSRPTRRSTDFGLPNFPLPFPVPVAAATMPRVVAESPSSRGGWSPRQPDLPSNNDFTSGGSIDAYPHRGCASCK